MNIKLKMILLSPIWLWRFFRIISKSNTYRRNPTLYVAQERHDYVLKRVKKILKTLKIQLKIKGFDKLPQSAILYANHVSNLDPLIILAALEKQSKEKSIKNKIVNFLAKQELENNWKTRIPLNLIDTFYLNRQNPREALKTIDSFGTFIKENKSLGVIFPEGTRSQSDKLLDFKPGAFKIPKSKFFAIVPITINNSGQALNPKRSKKLTIEVIFHDPIDAFKIQNLETYQIAHIVKNTIESKYTKQDVYVSKKSLKPQKVKNKLTYVEKRAKKQAKLEAKANKYKDF
ncbi:lysophospholipid acyltransferase family protein [Mycoplasma miroungirhinis]|uniref:1-acyl-sn-glycerol-3-phosphate acyltransferase n=1 Tax=Mycoplasma miroungirhinis TaxID=754516 RepID=A0A6M4JD79_9MOLU|nr:lysophospholipid acyltransferase family protein [Mycoplasma miroungirhinis]QJR44029.1 1-acyl-sn-glycerol-3-phosphate acyltransferase [Mycoplasma miroungirhinis]